MKAAKKIIAIILTIAISMPCIADIPLKLRKKGTWTRSSELVITISAVYYEVLNALIIEFNENFGEADLSLADKSCNVIYSNVVKAEDSVTKIFIPLQGLPAGDYYLSIALINGDIIEGSFSVCFSIYKQ